MSNRKRSGVSILHLNGVSYAKTNLPMINRLWDRFNNDPICPSQCTGDSGTVSDPEIDMENNSEYDSDNSEEEVNYVILSLLLNVQTPV
jgi:hypothetical protein